MPPAPPLSMPNDPPDNPALLTTALRIVAVCQATTIVLTWPLWEARTDPPLLPFVPGPSFGVGPLLLVTLAVAMIRPKWGVPAHTLAAALAIAWDQTRMQPQIVSHVVLMWGAIGPPSLRLVARAELVATWFYGGFWKLISPGFHDNVGTWLLTRLNPSATAGQCWWFGTAIIATELATALLVLSVRTRPFGAWLAFAMHLGILAMLSPFGVNYNSSVWPWNIALAVAAVAYFRELREPATIAVRRAARPAQAAAAFLLLAPLGHFFGAYDAYLAHSVYASHTPVPTIETGEGDSYSPLVRSMQILNAPMPPEHRTYRALFARVAQPGDVLIIEDPRWWYTTRGYGETILRYEELP